MSQLLENDDGYRYAGFDRRLVSLFAHSVCRVTKYSLCTNKVWTAVTGTGLQITGDTRKASVARLVGR